MGTRSLTHVKSGKQILCAIYRQFDGYPSGMGADIKEAIGETKLVNDFGNETLPTTANGMGCLAAFLVGKLKADTIGNVYLYAPGAKDCGEEYRYVVYDKDNRVMLKCVDVGWNTPDTILYDGPIADFDPEKAEEERAA